MQILAPYYRTSLEDMDKRGGLVDSSMGIQNQRKLVEAFIASDPLLSKMKVEEYFDDGYTGTNFERPQFYEMLERAKSGDITCIIVKDLSRFGRSYLEVGEYIEHIFPALGIRLISVTDGYDSNQYIGKTSGMDIAFRNLIYDTYSKDLSVKVKSAMHTKMKTGRYVTCAPYGYMRSAEDKHVITPDPATAPVVREIFLMAGRGISTTQIARELNSRGVETPLRSKKIKIKPASAECTPRWSHQTVISILKNIKYTGTMVSHTRESRCIRDKNQRRVPPEEWYVTENAHEGIVSWDEYEGANVMLQKPDYKGMQQSDCLDRVFYCGHCGRKLQKTFGLDTYFSCTTHQYLNGVDCKKVYWSKTDLENVLLPIYQTQMTVLEQHMAKAKKRRPEADPAVYASRVERLKKSVENCDTEKMRQYEQYRAGQLNREQFLAVKEQLAEKKARLQEEYDNAAEELAKLHQKAQEARECMKEAKQYLSQGSAEERLQEMYESITRVNVMDAEHIEVHWKFDDLFAELSEKEKDAG